MRPSRQVCIFHWFAKAVDIWGKVLECNYSAETARFEKRLLLHCWWIRDCSKGMLETYVGLISRLRVQKLIDVSKKTSPGQEKSFTSDGNHSNGGVAHASPTIA